MNRWLTSPALWPRKLLAGVVQCYRWTFKPWLGNACRFEPSCSAYALAALERHGAAAGSALTAWRLLRCHPWCDGGFDPVPASLAAACPHRLAGLFTRLWPPLPPQRDRAGGAGASSFAAASGGGESFGPSSASVLPPFEPNRRGPSRPAGTTGDPP